MNVSKFIVLEILPAISDAVLLNFLCFLIFKSPHSLKVHAQSDSILYGNGNQCRRLSSDILIIPRAERRYPCCFYSWTRRQQTMQFLAHHFSWIDVDVNKCADSWHVEQKLILCGYCRAKTLLTNYEKHLIIYHE